MKRDMDLIRDVLLKIEAANDPKLEELLPESTTPEYVASFTYNLELLVDAGFVRGDSYRTLKETLWRNLQLTWNGHEFLDAIRDPEIWRRTKKGASEAGLAGVKFMWELAKAYGKQIAKERLGFDLD